MQPQVTEINGEETTGPDAVETVGAPTFGINDGVAAPPTAAVGLPGSVDAPVAPMAPQAPIGAVGGTPGVDRMPGGAPEAGMPTGAEERAVGRAGDPPSRVGRITFEQGQVSMRPAHGQSWTAVERNRPVTSGDSLWVGKGSRAELRIGEMVLGLSEGSLIEIQQLGDRLLQLGLKSGSLGLLFEQPEKDSLVEVDLPHLATSLLAPGWYRFDAGDSESKASAETTVGVTVFKGRAEGHADDKAFDVTAGRRLELDGSSSAQPRLKDSPQVDGFDGFCAERHRLSQQDPALRYVSRGTVGYEDLDAHGSWTQSPEYGAIWRPHQVPATWAPFAFGHWVWIAPWGWTWVDDAPWGFAPFHYGRWVYFDNAWGWAPGPIGISPFYLPHLVTFVGGAGFGVGLGFGLGVGAVGWYPLGWGEPFFPGYACSYGYLHGINGANTPPQPFLGRRPPRGNLNAPHSITAVSAQAMRQSQALAGAHVAVPYQSLGHAHLGLATPGVKPGPQAVIGAVSPAAVVPPTIVTQRPLRNYGPAFSAPGSAGRGPYRFTPHQNTPVGNSLGRGPQIIRVPPGSQPPASQSYRIYRPMGRPYVPVAPLYRPSYGGRSEPFIGGHDFHPGIGHPNFPSHFGGGGFGGHPGFGGGGHFGGHR